MAYEAKRKEEKEEKERTEKAEKEKAAKEKEDKQKFDHSVMKAVEAELVKAMKTVNAARAKMMKEKIQLNVLREGKERTCLDSGANRAARTMRSQQEHEDAQEVQVEVADGTMTVMWKSGKGALISEREIQTILPLIPILLAWNTS